MAGADTDIGTWLAHHGAGDIEAEVRETDIETVEDLLVVVQERADWTLFIEDEARIDQLHAALEAVRGGGSSDDEATETQPEAVYYSSFETGDTKSGQRATFETEADDSDVARQLADTQLAAEVDEEFGGGDVIAETKTNTWEATQDSGTRTLCGRRWNSKWCCCRGQAKCSLRAVSHTSFYT